MRTYALSEQDGWTTNGAKITSSENLERIKAVLDNEAPVIVEHWLYRRSSSPERHVFDDFEEFMTYLNENARAGDIINVWNFGKSCTQQNILAHGKCPDDQDRVPQKGAY
jgi:hypothetical protein